MKVALQKFAALAALMMLAFGAVSASAQSIKENQAKIKSLPAFQGQEVLIPGQSAAVGNKPIHCVIEGDLRSYVPGTQNRVRMVNCTDKGIVKVYI